jgi:hypothetical protein
MAKSTPKYSFETIDQVLSDIKQKKGLEAPTKTTSLGSSKSVLPGSNINSVLSYGGGDPKKAMRIAEYSVPLESVYDRMNDGSYSARYENYLGAEGNENRLALQQSGWEQAGKGLLKNAIKSVNYAFDSVVGTAYGLTQALSTGELRDLYDNDLTNHLDDMNKKLDYALPNYYSDEQKSMSFLRSMGTANFWANDVAGGAAFVAGALLPQIAIGIATGGATLPSLGVATAKFGTKLAFKAGKELTEEAAKATIKKGIKNSLDDGLKAVGSTFEKVGQATGYTKGKNVIKSYQQAILGDKLGTFTNTTGFLARSSGFEAGMEARQALKESTDNYYQQFQKQNGRMPSPEEYSQFMDDAVRASNKVFGANMAILSLSNAVMFGKKILPESASNWVNKTIGGKVNNIIGLGTKSSVVDGKLTYTMLGANRAQKIAGKAYKTLSKPLTEGLYEEGLQGVASKTMKNYLEAKYDKNNLDGYSFWNSLNDSFAEQYGTNEGWKEMGIGMIIGFAGGAITPGALKNGYAFSGFGKNSYTSRRAEIESNIKRANDGIELLSNLNRTSATVAKEAALKSGNDSDFLGAEDTLSHYNFIRSQESINSYSQMKKDFNVVADNLQFEDESLDALNSAGLDVDTYRTKLKDDFSKSLENYQFAKKAVEALGLNKTLRDTPGNIAEISDALMFGIMAGKDSFENSKNIASQIDSIIGTEGVFNHLNFYNSLDQDKKDQFLELRDKKENLKELQDAAARVAQKIGKINATGQMTPELVENRRKKLSEQAVAIQDSIVNTQQRIDDLENILKTDFRNTKYNLSSETLDTIGTTEDIIGAVENIDKIDNLIQSFDKSGKKQEADTLRYLVNQFKISADSHREMINTHRKMMDTNYFSSKEGKGFLKSILGDKFTMSDDLKQLIEENDAVIDNSLNLNGIRGYSKVQDILESSIVDNDQLSDREKFRLESLIRISLSKGAYEKAVDNLQSMSKDMQTRMSPEGKQLATSPEDLRRINLTAEGLNNIKLIDEAINEITKELDYIINYSSKNIEKIKSLEEELAKLTEEKETLKQNLKKQKENTTTSSQEGVNIISTPVADIVESLSKLETVNEKLDWLRDNNLLEPITINGVKYNTVDYNGRVMVLMKIGKYNIPFYISTGQAGKKNVKVGAWYAVFGIGLERGWINKGSEAEINSSYNSKILQKLSKILNDGIGTIESREDNGNGKLKEGIGFLEETNENLNAFNDSMNLPTKPAGKNTDIEDFYKHVNSTLSLINEELTKLNEENTVQQNEVFTDTEQEDLLNKKIEDLKKQIDELKRPFKIIESPEYIRYYELASKAERNSLTDKEKEELEELRTDIDQWTLITGVVVDGFRLSDLLLQKSVLENSIIEKVKDIEIPTSEDTLDEIDFADSATKANYKYGLVYDKVFASKDGDLITLHNMNSEALIDILGKDFIDQNGIVIETDPTGKDNLVLTQDSIDKINQNSNLRIRNTERNMLTKFSVVLERVVGLDGNATYRPLSSNFSEEINGGQGHDIQAIFEASKGDDVEITTDLDNVYNIRIINEYKEELNNFNMKPQKSEQDRIELEKAFNKLISKLNLQAKINGKVVSTMKGLNKTIKDKNSDNVYVQFRANIFSDPDQINAILTGSGEYSIKITNNAGEFIKPKVTVSETLMGHPNYNYTETEDGLLATEFRGLSDVEANAIVDVGYVLGTKTFTRDNQTVNTVFLKKLMNKKSTNKIPFIVLNVGGKRVAYPAKVNSFGEAEVSQFESVYADRTTDPVTKANALNRILAKNGIDIKQPGNAFIGFFDSNINDKFFQEKLAQLKNVNYFYKVDDWIDLNVDLQDIVKTQLSVDINVLNPFHSPKLSFNYDELNLKDFVPPKKGKKKSKTASKSKNVEVNLADLFNNDKNCPK